MHHGYDQNHKDFRKKSGNALSIRLTESAVFLRTDGPPSRRNSAALDNARSSILRSLLVLELVKPTKITSIEVELTATASTAWPEGIGARRIDVTEIHRVFHATSTYFRAVKAKDHRRAASIGPGISYFNDIEFRDGPGDLVDNVEEEIDWDELRGRSERQGLDPPVHVSARSRSRDLSRDVSRSHSEIHPTQHPVASTSRIHAQESAGSSFTERRNDSSFDSPPTLAQQRTRANRHFSVDVGQLQRVPYSHGDYEQVLAQQLAPIPPYSPYPLSLPDQIISPASTLNSVASPMHESPTTEEPKSIFSMTGESSYRYRGSAHSLPFSTQHQDHPQLSRRPSLVDVLENESPESPEHCQSSTPAEIPTPRSQSPSHNSHNSQTHLGQSIGLPASRSSGRPESLSRSRPSLMTPNTQSSSSSSIPHSQGLHQSPSPPRSSSVTRNGTERGRGGPRFTFQAVSNILRDVVRSSSPSHVKSSSRSRKLDGGASMERNRRFAAEHEQERERGLVGGDDSVGPSGRRGRTMERPALVSGADSETNVRFNTSGQGMDVEREESRSRRSRVRGKSVIDKLLGEKEKDGKERGRDKEKKGKEKYEHGWKEFKKGTYTYPISFSIPSNAPPTMQCDYGFVSWRLKAVVHRPGTFKPKMVASREVTIITCPTEEDTEDTENIIVERHWEQQLQYLISISGRSFYIGGTIPVTFTLLPLAKAKIHRLSVFLEERVDYYTHMRRIARTDPPTRYNLLTIKPEGKSGPPILPLESDCPDALRESPLFALVDPSASDAELSEVASNLMGPGPWTFHKDLKLPASCNNLRFTNKNRRSNMIVSHVLKVIMRVERGDDLHVEPKTGKKKVFDIVVQTPILILSCRCNPEWSSLPRYAEVFDDATAITPSCPCQVARAKARSEAHAQGTGFANAGHGIVMTALDRIASRHSSDSSTASAAETSPIQPHSMSSMRYHGLGHGHGQTLTDSLVYTNDLYERLVSGQESESGEAPPAYNVASSTGSTRSTVPLVHGGVAGGVAAI